jgi:SAM-dependent methyltransferase
VIQKFNPKQDKNQKSYSGFEGLVLGEKYLSNYMEHIVELFLIHFDGNQPGTLILDFGAGLGNLSKIWYKKTRIKPDCLEIDPHQASMIRNSGYKCYESLSQSLNKYDFIFTSNVLEHIPDDLEVLRELYDVTKSGGRIAIYVPAFMCIFSGLDIDCGHYRRYTRKGLKQKVESVGFRCKKVQYVDSIGWFAALLTRIVGYKNFGIGSDMSFKVYDRWVFPLSKVFDIVFAKHIFGKNVLIYAEKP